ncbi:hypothetical protein OF83DRAFT_712428 [Amylostereum chailletii]|nr:hypothetical protein OF83DRAFT_712428 [Amylostereum chailletii]
MSGGLTDDQVQLVRDTLSSVTDDRIFPEIVETALFAMFTVLICVSTGIHLTKGLRNWTSWAMVILTLFMYSSSACAWACDLKIMWNELNIFLPGLLSPTAQVGADIDGALIALDGRWIFSYCVLSQINILLSDAIVLWRACLVWNWHRGVVCVTVLFLVSMFGLNIFYILTEVTTYFPTTAPGSRLPAASDFADVDVALFSLSACTNVWATSMVACRAWIHRREISRYFQKQAPKSVVENVMVLLVESGVIYSIIMVIYVLSGSPFKPLLGTASVYYWSVVVTQVAESESSRPISSKLQLLIPFFSRRACIPH